MTTLTRQAEYALEQKLCAHFKVPRNKMVKEYALSEAGEQLPVGKYPIFEELSATMPYFYSVQAKKENMFNLMLPGKFEKSELREHMDTALAFLNTTSEVATSVYMTGMVWVMRLIHPDDRNYKGSIIVPYLLKQKYCREGLLSIQPIQSYLTYTFGDRQASE